MGAAIEVRAGSFQANSGVALGLVSAVAMASLPILAVESYTQGLDWLDVLLWRFTVGAIITWVLVACIPTARREAVALDRRTAWMLVGLGVLFVTESGTFYAALERIPVSLATLVSYATLGIVPLLSQRYARPLGAVGWLAVLSAALGVFIAVGGPTGGFDAFGVALALGSATFHAAWAILAARAGGERRTMTVSGASPLMAIALMSTGTAVALGCMQLLRGGTLSPAGVPADAWRFLVPLGSLSVLGIATWYAAARRIGAARTTIVSTAQLIITIVLAALVLHETVGLEQALGALLITAAILLVRDAPTSTPERPPPVDRPPTPPRPVDTNAGGFGA